MTVTDPDTNDSIPEPVAAVHLTVSGHVQGVGFRPFIYQLAERFGLAGSVCNDTRGVTIEVEGDEV